MRAMMFLGMLGIAGSCLAQEPPITNGSASMLSALQDQPTPQKPKEQAKDKQKKGEKSGDPKKADSEGQPPVKEGEKEGDKQDEKKAEDAPAEDEQEKPAKLPTIYAEGGWADWSLTGSQRKFRQYATPPRGGFLKDLRISPVYPSRKSDVFMTVKSLGQPDYIAEGRALFQYGSTWLTGLLARNEFFDPSPAVIPLSEWRRDAFFIRQSLTKDFALSYRYRYDEPSWYFNPPSDPLKQSMRFQDLTAGGKLGNGYASFSLMDFSYSDRTSVLPDTKTRSARIGYLWEVNPNVDLQAAVTRVWIDQFARATSRVDTIALDGNVALGPATDVELAWRQRNIDMPVVQNTWVREQSMGSVKLAHHWKRWAGQLGFRVSEVERVRSDQSWVDLPRWFTFDGKINGRINRNLRFMLRGSTQSLSNAPTFVTTDPRNLWFDGRDMIMLRVDANAPNLNGYLTYSYRQWRNATRAANVTTNIVTVGGDWQITPTINMFAEFAREDWAGKTDVTTFPTLDNFAPDSNTYVLGLNWSLNDRTYLSLSYTEFANDNDNPLLLRDGNTHGRFFTLNGRYQFSNDMEVGLVLAPWSFRDQLFNTVNYDATVVMVTASAKF